MAGYKMSNTKGEPSVTRISLMSCYRWAMKDGWLKMLNIAAGMTMGNKKESKVKQSKAAYVSAHPWLQGLEWKKVLIINCNHDQIPSPKVIGDEGIEEERRLYFVGMTRDRAWTLHNPAWKTISVHHGVVPESSWIIRRKPMYWWMWRYVFTMNHGWCINLLIALV